MRMRRLCELASLTMTVALLCQVGTAADWPQWRGPNRDAVSAETGLLKEWPKEGPPLLWDLHGLGRGFSGTTIVGNRLYTMGDLEEGGARSQFVMAFDLTAKSRLWTTRVGPPHGDGSRCTPTVSGAQVFALGTEGDLVCVDAESGKELWRKNFGADFGGRIMSGWKYSESPLVDGERVVVAPGGPDAPVAALKKSTGETAWVCKPPQSDVMGGAGYASVVVSEGAGVRQYVTLMGKGAIGVKADDGMFLWSYARVANGVANIATPVCSGEYVVVSSAYGTGSACLKLAPKDGGVVAEEVYWLGADTFQCHHGGYLRIGDFIYGAHGHNQGKPICVEMKTGKLRWLGEQPGKGSGSVICADGNLIFRYEDNTIALIEAKPDAFSLKSTFKVPGRPGMGGPGWAHPALADGKLYLRHNDVLFCYDLKAR